LAEGKLRRVSERGQVVLEQLVAERGTIPRGTKKVLQRSQIK
jgi:hypothetical protein